MLRHSDGDFGLFLWGLARSAGGSWKRVVLGSAWGVMGRELSYLVLVVTAGDHVLGIQKIRSWEYHSQHFLQVLNPKTGLFCKRQALCNGLNHVDDKDIANELKK